MSQAETNAKVLRDGLSKTKRERGENASPDLEEQATLPAKKEYCREFGDGPETKSGWNARLNGKNVRKRKIARRQKRR